jgi:Phosphotransferase enzyme family
MTPLSRALRLLEEQHALGPETVLRVNLGAMGELTLEVDQPAGQRWFRFSGDTLTEVHLNGDERVPLAAMPREGDANWRVLSWRPGRRLALRRDDGTGPRLVKGYRPRRFGPAVRALERVGEALCEGEGFIVPRLLRVNEQVGAYEATWLGGEQPAVVTTNTQAYGRVGRALLDFQRRVRTADLPEHDAAAELAVLDDLAQRSVVALGRLPEGWIEARRRAQQAVPRHEVLVAAHRDLHDGQLLVDDEHVGLLDFDGLCAASSALDLANLSAHLELRALQGIEGADTYSAEACGRALLEALGDDDQGRLHEPLRFYQASTFLRLALLYALRPRWASLSPSLVRYAARCLDELALA